MKAIATKVFKSEKSNLNFVTISVEYNGVIDPRRWQMVTTLELEEKQEIDTSKIILTDTPIRYKDSITGEWTESKNLFQVHIRL
jgi:hypothetical protein